MMSISADTDDGVGTYLRTEIVPPPLPVRLRGELGAGLSVTVVRNVVDDEGALLTHGVDCQGARSRVLTDNA